MFVLELGLGQITRRGTLGMWTKIGLPRWQGVGAVRHQSWHGSVSRNAGQYMINIWLMMVNDGYPLVICYIAMENRWPIEIDGFPNLKMVDLSMANC